MMGASSAMALCLPPPVCGSLLSASPPSVRLLPVYQHCPRPLLARPLRALAAEDDSSDPADDLELKLGKRRRSRKDKPTSIDVAPPKPPPKEWDSMTLAEKAWEVYVGEKGALFWINKLAYAAIFAVVGGWVVFRFVGPALGWYQLESPLLPPDKVFGGSK